MKKLIQALFLMFVACDNGKNTKKDLEECEILSLSQFRSFGYSDEVKERTKRVKKLIEECEDKKNKNKNG